MVHWKRNEGVMPRNPDLKPAAYILEHVDTGDIYIGSTRNVTDRLRGHLSALRNNHHGNKPLQERFNHSPAVVLKETIPASSRDEAFEIEQRLMDENKNNPQLLNRNSRVGYRDEEMNVKVIEKLKSTPRTEKQLAALKEFHPRSRHWVGRKHSDETRVKMRQAMTPAKQKQVDGLIERLGKKVLVDGIEYRSASEAAKAKGVSQPTIVRWCNDPNHTDVNFT
jgi:predicted GIY-YIG superfamily endonuclease